MRISQKGIDLIKSFEGLRLDAYQDSVGVWTIGFGHTAPDIKAGQRITIEQADRYLADDIRFAEECIQDLVLPPLTQGQYDAICSFIFNLGCVAFSKSTLLKYINTGDIDRAAKEFEKWVHAGGKKLPGLVRRRQAEAERFVA